MLGGGDGWGQPGRGREEYEFFQEIRDFPLDIAISFSKKTPARLKGETGYITGPASWSGWHNESSPVLDRGSATASYEGARALRDPFDVEQRAIARPAQNLQEL